MFMRKLGSSGIDISAVGFGAWVTGAWMWGGADDEKSIAAIHAALDHGINLIDTAPVYGYGHSEQVVGRAIHDRRDREVLATKCGLIWDREEGTMLFYADDKGATLRPTDNKTAKKIYKNLRPASIREEVERSLRNLRTDRIDLLQTHWQDPSTPLAETVAELQRLKEEGKIRAMGVSNCDLGALAGLRPDRLRPGEIQPPGPQAGRQRNAWPGAASKTSPCWPIRRCPTACSPASCEPTASTSRAICGRRTRASNRRTSRGSTIC